jgi:hypothetical protein
MKPDTLMETPVSKSMLAFIMSCPFLLTTSPSFDGPTKAMDGLLQNEMDISALEHSDLVVRRTGKEAFSRAMQYPLAFPMVLPAF